MKMICRPQGTHLVQTILLMALIPLLFPLTITGQTATDTLISPQGDTVVIRAIPALEVNAQIEEVTSLFNSFRDVVREVKAIAMLDSLLIDANMLADMEETRLANPDLDLSPRNLQDLASQWEVYKVDLINWQEKIKKRISELETNVFEANKTRRIWEITEEVSRNQDLPAGYIDRIRDIRKEAGLLAASLKNRQDTVLIYQNEITDLQIRVNKALVFLAEKQKELQAQYFLKDSPALWEMKDTTMQQTSLPEQVKKSISENYRQLKNFITENRSKTYLLAFIYLILLVVFYFLKREFSLGHTQEESNKSRWTTVILQQFPASAFVLTVSSSMLLFHAFPMAVREIMQLLLVIPSLILLPRIISKQLYPILFSLVVLFILGEIHYFLFNNTLIARILLIFESAFTIWLLAHFVQQNSPLFQGLNNFFKGLIGLLKPLFIFLIGVSILANLFGYMSLAVLVSKALINSILVAVLLLVLVIVLYSFLIALFTTRFFMHSNIISQKGNKLLDSIYSLLLTLGFFVWLRSIAISLGIYKQIYAWFIGLFSYTWEMGSVSISIGGILAFVLIIVLTSFISRLINVILEEEVFPRIRLSRGVPGAISMIVSYFIVGFGIYVAISAAGIDLSKFGLIAGALGVGIGFGLQGVVYNFISGLILALERPIQRGDTVEVGALLGDVKKIGVRASTIRTYDGSEVIVPNGNLISNEVINWTLTDRKRRRIVPITVAYGNKPREIMKILFKVAEAHPEVLDYPKPWPLFDGFGDHGLNFRVLFWVDLDRGLTVTSEVAVNIYDALEEAGITIPYQQQDIHIKSFDPTVQDVIFPWTKQEIKGKRGTKQQGKKGKGETDTSSPTPSGE